MTQRGPGPVRSTNSSPRAPPCPPRGGTSPGSKDAPRRPGPPGGTPPPSQGGWARWTGPCSTSRPGGEVLDFALSRASRRPPLVVATEGWPPNVVRKAAELLRPRGATVVASAEDAPLPFADGSFALVTSRHPVRPHWREIARVLRSGGTYLAQHVGPDSAYEVVEYFLGPQPTERRHARHPDRERRDAEAAGLEIVELRAERLRMEFFDIAAVVHFLRKVIWMVPGFTVEAYRERLRELHERIESEGPFVAHSSRHLVEARTPEAPQT